MVLAVCRYIESCDYIPTLEELSRQVQLSPFHLQREFKKVLGITPRNYADAHRQLRFKKALKMGDDIALATYDAGYGSSSRIYEQSPRYLGMTPKAYKQKGKGQTIYYSVVNCPLGLLLLATTKKGICAVRIGGSRKMLVGELKDEFENAVIHKADSAKYLGVNIHKTLNWNDHINSIATKANNTRAFIQRNLRSCPKDTKALCYTTLVRPLMEYAAVIWDPHSAEYSRKLEMVQRRSAHMVCGDWRRYSSVSSMLHNLQWPTLAERRAW